MSVDQAGGLRRTRGEDFAGPRAYGTRTVALVRAAKHHGPRAPFLGQQEQALDELGTFLPSPGFHRHPRPNCRNRRRRDGDRRFNRNLLL